MSVERPRAPQGRRPWPPSSRYLGAAPLSITTNKLVSNRLKYPTKQTPKHMRWTLKRDEKAYLLVVRVY
jgi:hypothetical protein